jgi:hypothetical protein
MVSTVVTPKPTLAGVAPRFNQKLTQDITTIKLKKKKKNFNTLFNQDTLKTGHIYK